VFFKIPHANLYAMIVTALAIIPIAFATALALIFICKSMYDDINCGIECSLNSLKYLFNNWYLP
jgi:hypothetical protein